MAYFAWHYVQLMLEGAEPQVDLIIEYRKCNQMVAIGSSQRCKEERNREELASKKTGCCSKSAKTA